LQNNQEEILLEWLEVHATLQQRAPEEQLPDLLSFGAMHEKTKLAMLPLLGNRGRWLAQFNNRWAFALPEAETLDDTVFLQGEFKERLEFIQKLRRTAAEAALELIKKTWQEDDFQTRAEFVKALAIGISAADQAFLEQAWADTRKEVRQEAAALLALLPQTALVKKLEEELLKAVKINKKDQNPEFEVTLPDTLSEELKKCGLREHFKPLPDGVKANWLAQMVSMVSPEFWEAQSGFDAAALLEAAYEDDYKNIWFWGWATAAKRLGNYRWLEAMHRFFMNRKQKQRSTLNFSMDFIYQDLPNTLFNSLSLEYLQKDSKALLNDNHPAMILLLQEYQKWDNELAVEVLSRIKAAIANDSGVFNWNQKTLLKRASFAVHPSLYAQMELDWPVELGYSWQNEVTNFLGTLRFRKEIFDLKGGGSI
jgi:hypothetical protein